MAAEREPRGPRAHRRSTSPAALSVLAILAALVVPGSMLLLEVAAAPGSSAHASSTLPSAVDAEAPAAALTVLAAPAGAGLVREGDDVRVRVTVSNDGDAPSTALSISLQLDGSAPADRDALAAWFSGDPADAAPDSMRTVATATLSPLDPGASAVLDLVVPASTSIVNGGFGARPALVTAHEAEAGAVAADRTALVWVPDDAPTTAVPTTFVAAVTTPGRSGALLSADELDELTAEAGALTRTLDAVAGRPVVLGIDPRVVASIRVLGDAAPANALAFLDRLERVPNETFMLPWADADPVATLAATGESLPQPEGAGSALDAPVEAPVEPEDTATPGPSAPSDDAAEAADDAAAEAGAELLAELSSWPVTLAGWSWLSADGLDESSLGALVDEGLAIAIVPTTATDGRAALSASGATLLGADSALSDAAQQASLAGSQQAHDAGLARLGALLAAAATDGAPHAIVELSREQLASTDRLVSTIGQTIMLPWADPARASAALEAGAQSGQPSGPALDEQRAVAVESALKAERADRRFAEIAEPSTAVTDVRRLELLAALSLGWGAQSTAALDGFVSESESLRTSVRVVESSAITLLADRTSLPVTVQNDLDVAVRVFVHVDPDNGRLRVLDSDVETVVEPQSQTRALVPVESVTNGDVRITVSVRDADARELGTPTRVALNLQAGWETLGTLVVGGATLLLLIVGIARDLRKRERRREVERLEREAAAGEHPAASTEPRA